MNLRQDKALAVSASPSTQYNITLSSSIQGGNLIVVGFTSSLTGWGRLISAVTDDKGNTYTNINAQNSSNASTELWYCYNAIAGATIVTFTVASGWPGGNTIVAQVREYTGVLSTSDPLDKSKQSNGSGTALSSGSTAATTQANELVVGLGISAISGITYTMGAGFNNMYAYNTNANDNIVMEDKVVSATGAQAATFTSSQSWSWAAAVATFKGAPVTTNQKTLGILTTLEKAPQYKTIALNTILESNSRTFNGYKYSKNVTIQVSKVGGALTNFPVLVSITGDANLKTVANGGHVQNSNGYDIVFADANGYAIPFEVEKYDSTAGTLLAWVNVPSISGTVNTTIQMLYGNSNISTTQATPSKVWDSYYKAVYHMNEDPSGTAPQLTDSTGNANNLTTQNSMSSSELVPGQIGSAIDFNVSPATTQYASKADAGTNDTLRGTNITDMMLEMWFNADSLPNNEAFPVSKYNYSSGLGYAVSLGSSGQINWKINGGFHVLSTANTQFAVSGWYHLVCTFVGGTTMLVYINGVQVGSLSISSTTLSPYTGDFVLATASDAEGSAASFSLRGKLDEVRVTLGSSRSTAWITTSYNNQSSPSTFLSVGSEQVYGNNTVAMYTDLVATPHTTTGILTTLEKYPQNKTVALKTTLEVKTQKTLATLTTLESAIKKTTVALATTLENVRNKTIALVTTLSKPGTTTIALAATLEANIRKTVAILTTLEEYPKHKTVAVLTTLEKTVRQTLGLLTTLESLKQKSTVALLTTLESTAKYKTLAVLTTLEEYPRFRTVALKTTLETAAKKLTVALLTTIQSLPKAGTVAMLTTLEEKPSYKTVAINTILEQTGKSTVALRTDFGAVVNATLATFVTLEATKNSTVAINTNLNILVGSTVPLLTTLERVGYSTTATLTTLEANIRTTLAVKTTLEKPVSKTIAILTTLQSAQKFITVAINTVLEHSAHQTLALSTTLEAVVPVYAFIDAQNLLNTITETVGTFTGTRYRGYGFTPSRTGYVTQIAIQRDKGTFGLKFYFDQGDSNSIPLHTPTNAPYSFTVPNTQIIGGYQVFSLPKPFYVVGGAQYVFYVAPWDTVADSYQNDSQNMYFFAGTGFGGKEITNINGTWSNEQLVPVFTIYLQTGATLAIQTRLDWQTLYSTTAILTTFESAAQKQTVAINTTLEKTINTTIALVTTFESAKQKATIALYTLLESAKKYGTVALLTTLESAIKYLTVAVLTTLSKPSMVTLALKTTLETRPFGSTLGMVTILEKPADINVAINTILEATTFKTLAILTTLETTGKKRTLALFTTLESTPQHSTVGLLTTLSKPAQSTVALTTTLERIRQRTIALATTLEQQTRSTVALQTILEGITQNTLALSTLLETSPVESTVALLTTLETAPKYSTVAIITTLESVPQKETLALLTTLEWTTRSTIALHTTLESARQYSTVALVTTLESHPVYSTIALTTRLESVPKFSTVALHTTLESLPQKSTVAIQTVLETPFLAQRIALLTIMDFKQGLGTVALKTTLESLPQKSTIAIQTVLETHGIFSTLALSTTLETTGKSTLALFTDMHGFGKDQLALLTNLYHFIGWHNDDLYHSYIGYAENAKPQPSGGWVDDGSSW